MKRVASCAGDYGHFDESGNLYVVDRLKEMLKFKGFQVKKLAASRVIDFLPNSYVA